MLATILATLTLSLTGHAAPVPTVTCSEDSWCWNAFIDGNHQGHYFPMMPED